MSLYALDRAAGVGLIAEESNTEHEVQAIRGLHCASTPSAIIGSELAESAGDGYQRLT